MSGLSSHVLYAGSASGGSPAKRDAALVDAVGADGRAGVGRGRDDADAMRRGGGVVGGSQRSESREASNLGKHNVSFSTQKRMSVDIIFRRRGITALRVYW